MRDLAVALVWGSIMATARVFDRLGEKVSTWSYERSQRGPS